MSAPEDRLADAAVRAMAASGVDARVSLGARLRSDRADVVRATATTSDGTNLSLVLKAPHDAGDGWVRERAALAVLRDHDVPGATVLLAACDDPPLLVLSDVGEHPSLADALLGGDARAAQDAVVPGDTCPDNALLTSAGPVLIDWEGATHRHVAWEAAYLEVPWPTCWCSWAMPPEVVGTALTAWRTALAPVVPAVAEETFAEDLLRARTAWAFVSLEWFLPAALGGDPPPVQPMLAGLVHRALVEHLGPAPLALAPAFR